MSDLRWGSHTEQAYSSDGLHGFRKFRSCETQLIEFIDDVTRNLYVLESVDKAKYLGVTISEDLKWESSHTEQAYSSDGLTNDLYACSLTEVEPMFRLRRRKPRVLLALPQMLLMWLSHLRSSLIADNVILLVLVTCYNI
jgi:hypothetical protein